MSVDVVLPDSAWQGVDAGVEALVDAWLVPQGAVVERGQAVARVVLVKSTLQVDAPASGLLDAILVPAGSTFARGRPLARIAPSPA